MTERELQDLLHRHASVLGVPGAAAGLLHGGHVTTACVGVADVRTDEPVTPESRFGVGSLTKSMCATVIARLAAAGRLSLEDRVAAHVPELRGAAWAESATTRDLLANRSSSDSRPAAASLAMTVAHIDFVSNPTPKRLSAVTGSSVPDVGDTNGTAAGDMACVRRRRRPGA